MSYDCIIRVCLKCVYLRNSTPPVLMIAALATAENAASKSMTALRILLQYKVIIYFTRRVYVLRTKDGRAIREPSDS